MAKTKNSISSLLEQFMILQRNSMEIISKLSDVATTSADNVVFRITGDDGTVSTIPVPSLGFYKNEIRRVENTVQALAGLGDSNAVIKMPDGSTKRIFEASVMRDPKRIETLNVPGQFQIRNNWFFEEMLNPLLFVTFDVSGQVPDGMRHAEVKRVIIFPRGDEDREWFDENYRGNNDISHDRFLLDLDANDIPYFVDEDKVELPPAVIRNTGDFDVLNVSEEDAEIESNGRVVVVKKRKYKLNKLTYTDVLSGTTDSKTLAVGDKMLTSDGSVYEITGVIGEKKQVLMKRIQGSQPITLGVGVLSLYSKPFTSKNVRVNVGFDERQVIFIKPIEPKFSVIASRWSPGVGIWSNELRVNTEAGDVTLENFYKEQVTDFGMQLMNNAKERTVSSMLGEVPNVPSVSEEDFEVVPINNHVKDTEEAEIINDKLSQKDELLNEIKQIDEAIDEKKNDLNNNASTKTGAERRKIKADLQTLAREKTSKVNLYASVVRELSTLAKENPTVTSSTKYRVRGFWPMPEPALSETTAPQEVIQFRVSYRYIRKDGSVPQTRQIEFVDNDGTVMAGFFSNWTEYKTDIRERIFDPETGFYKWADESISDAEEVNINQLDIPINKGEQVQIRIKSVSEAGWPINPIESEWSNIVTIDFPDDLQVEDDSVAALSEAAAEETRVRFQEELAAQGLDLHLLSAFTSGDRYFSHQATDIASGFFTQEGRVIDLLEKLKSIDDELSTLRQLVQRAKGTLAIYLVDADGNVTNIGRNSTTEIFAGYYRDLITTGTGTSAVLDHGAIITRAYTIRIENSAATPLELASYMPGGMGERVDDSTPAAGGSVDYVNARQYDRVPFVLSGAREGLPGSLSHISPFQSSQVKGQWLYLRRKSVGLDEDLYDRTDPTNDATTDLQGVVPYLPTLPTLPINGCYLMPTNPTSTTGPHPDVWNGTTPGNGGGSLTEFCIHKDHPRLTGAFTNDLIQPDLTPDGRLSYPGFMHSDFFWKDTTQPDGKLQLEYIEPNDTALPFATAPNYPAKYGFVRGDKWLIGRYTCGAYLYLLPGAYETVSVDGSTELAKRELEFGEENAINLTLVFQFRCSDILGNIGGYRTTGDISNINYTKKIGIDVQVRNESLFSFDVEVSAKYEQDSLARPVYVPNVALDRLGSIRRQANSSGTSSI